MGAVWLSLLLLSLLFLVSTCGGNRPQQVEADQQVQSDAYNLQVALNLEFLEAEFFLNSAYGYGLEGVAPELALNGSKPRGARKARLDDLTSDLTAQLALQEVGHLRAIQRVLGDAHYFKRPRLDVSRRVFADLLDAALGQRLRPRFDVYAGPLNYMLGVYVVPYVGLTGYVGAARNLNTPTYKRLVAGLLAVEAGQDAVTRQYLYERRSQRVEPYSFTVEEVTNRISALRNRLAGSGNGTAATVDEGLTVEQKLGAEQRVTGNVLAADADSVAYSTAPEQIFATVYGTGDAGIPGGFFPDGAKGHIAESLLAIAH